MFPSKVKPHPSTDSSVMKDGANLDGACREVVGELRDVMTWLGSEKLSPDQFRKMIIELEARKLSRFGFSLSAATSPEGRSHFVLRYADTKKICASLEFDPETKELLVHQLCNSILPR